MIKFDLFRTPFLGALHRVRKRPPVRRGNPAASAPAPIGQRPARRPPCPGPPCDHSDADPSLLSVRTRISEPAARAQPGTIRRGVCRTVTRPRIRRSLRPHRMREEAPALPKQQFEHKPWRPGSHQVVCGHFQPAIWLQQWVCNPQRLPGPTDPCDFHLSSQNYNGRVYARWSHQENTEVLIMKVLMHNCKCYEDFGNFFVFCNMIYNCK